MPSGLKSLWVFREVGHRAQKKFGFIASPVHWPRIFWSRLSSHRSNYLEHFNITNKNINNGKRCLSPWNLMRWKCIFFSGCLSVWSKRLAKWEFDQTNGHLSQTLSVDWVLFWHLINIKNRRYLNSWFALSVTSSNWKIFRHRSLSWMHFFILLPG